MPNAYGKTLDKTFLSIEIAEERNLIHRDYLAHTLRWSHIVGYCQKNLRKEHTIVDIGCGKEVPLLKTLYVNRCAPKHYVGIDAGKINKVPKAVQTGLETEAISAEFLENTLFSSDLNLETPSIITCFEVLEHVEMPIAKQMLKDIYKLTDENTQVFISTPNFNGKAAANHVNEMTFKQLYDLLISENFKINNVYGTFASIKDILPELEKDGLLSTFNKLKDYYDLSYLSTIFAPLYPEQSRNCLWRVSK